MLKHRPERYRRDGAPYSKQYPTTGTNFEQTIQFGEENWKLNDEHWLN